MHLSLSATKIPGLSVSPEILIEINMVKAMQKNIPFSITDNKVVLSEAIPKHMFRSVVHQKKYLHQAPLDYICVFDFEATCSNDNSLKTSEIIEFPIVIVDVKNKKIKAEF